MAILTTDRMRLCVKISGEWVMALFVAAAVVSAWRGAWVLLDAILLPEHPIASAAASLVWVPQALWLAVALSLCWPRLFKSSKDIVCCFHVLKGFTVRRAVGVRDDLVAYGISGPLA